jgi:hypothetical protein
MKKIILIALLVMMVLVLSACGAGPNVLANSPNEQGQVAGFWWGLWHGIISPIALIVSLVYDNVGVYEVYNNGFGYNLGFILGALIIFGGGGRGSKRSRRRKR